MSEVSWRIWVDTGGTFTDCLALDPDGGLHRAKVLSSSALRGRVAEVVAPRRLRLAARWEVPDDFFAGFSFRLLAGEERGVEVASWRAATGELELAGELGSAPRAGDACELRSPEEAPVLAARLVTGTSGGRELPPLALRLATTRGTNALLERHGAPPVLFITRGFADLLTIGTQQRPELFALAVEKPAPLYGEVVEVDERLAADGSVLRALAPGEVEAAGRRQLDTGARTAAVAFLHAYRDDAHEQAAAAALRRAGFSHVAASAELAPLIKLLPRAETAVVEAYLAPVVGDYLQRVAAALPAGSLSVMTSAGGLVGAASYRAKDSLLSGPAGGVVGAARAGRRAGWQRLLAFDMGGTSTDVARYDGDYEYLFEHRVGDARLVAPALAIESVAAGGGSICSFDGRQLKVGPESSGAEPGPACYGAGGPLTVTDVNLLLGRLDAERFEIPVDRPAAKAALAALRSEVAAATGEAPATEELLAGLLQIADERMADAIRSISVRRGYDPADHALVAFGGAGAQHACAVAGLLGVAAVLVPPDASLLSAAGLGVAVVERFAQRQVLAPLAEVTGRLPGWLEELAGEAAAEVAREGVPAAEVEVRRRLVSLRFAGQESAVEVTWEEGTDLPTAFARRYQELYGYRPAGRAVEVESLRVVASSKLPADDPPAAVGERQPATASRHQRAFLGGRWQEAPVFERAELAAGATFAGAALVVERHSATVVAPGWGGEVDGAGTLVLTPPPG